MSIQKEYIGDGVYADYAYGQIILTTENGIETTNTIYLEPEVLAALADYMRRAGFTNTQTKKLIS